MVRTSHVGSFPLPHSVENVERVIRDLWRVGLDVPPYPQLRSFIDIYLQPLAENGFLVEKGGFYFLEDPGKLRDLMGYEPFIPEAEELVKAVRDGVVGFKWLRGPVTGVFTLSSRIYLEKDISRGLYATLLRESRLVEFIADYVRRNLEYLAGLGYNVLFIDEPVLGVLVGRRRILLGYSEESIREIIGRVYRGLPGMHGIHVCGRISPRLFNLLSSIKELNILNFEFHDNPLNKEFIDKELLEANDKLLAPGIASSKNPVVEPLDELRTLLGEIIERAGGRVDLVSADCGFGGLAVDEGGSEKAYLIGLEKLRRIKRVVDELNAANK